GALDSGNRAGAFSLRLPWRTIARAPTRRQELIGDARSCVAKRRPKTPPPFGPGVENEGSEIVAGPIAQAGTSKSSQGLHESVGQRGVGGAEGARGSGARARARDA